MTSDEMREAVARVIDPELDAHLENRGLAKCRALVAIAYEQADAILSMISASPVDEESKRLREALEPAWQPIEAAPETGWGQTIECLLYGLGLGVRTGHIGRLGASRWASIPSLHGNAIADWGATHWMPLPAPPALTNNISTGSPAESETEPSA